jgi:3-deoxy-7-phosphoheptulonate synthase
MSLVLIWGRPCHPKLYGLRLSSYGILGANKPVVRVARMAGQFAKYIPALITRLRFTNRYRPRSNLTEIVDGKEIPSFRGDNINGFDPSERALDPNRLIRCIPSPRKYI